MVAGYNVERDRVTKTQAEAEAAVLAALQPP